jgi:hypothetical protein
MRYLTLLLLTFALLGCQRKQVMKEVVSLSEISPHVMDAAAKALPQVKFEIARKIKINGQDAYEIRGKMPNGKIREVEVSAAGEVLEIE